ncbi:MULTISPECIES: organic hydroperoxide resistance protein [unclassified Solwaraspora]|uniref:organic hydroperoxide resistance protein n=1 Tax=unclassified Solwaraspora TaxID=2627926 RepID=UPI00259BB320|nr:organic hydroperoxide resistance protein [Solwaraspora sp. WMMA2056]WJK41384.1 organic hydroperoxide resistance protein [Solwaraspora sp. WMMA2056]
MQALYTAEALATGDGRNGHVRSSDGILDLDVVMPKELGGAGGATNPEQLFAAGYAACFHSALRAVARQSKADVTGSTVTARIGLGKLADGRFGLTAALTVELPALDRATAEELLTAAHQLCPYSNATRGNIDVALSLASAA